MTWEIIEFQKEVRVFRIQLSSGEEILIVLEEGEPRFYIETDIKYSYFESCKKKEAKRMKELAKIGLMKGAEKE